jgi:hypothetical protein
LIGNAISNSSLVVNSPGICQYQVIDQKGSMLSEGKIEKGYTSINTGIVTSGVYIIRFTDGEQQWSEKFFKR